MSSVFSNLSRANSLVRLVEDVKKNKSSTVGINLSSLIPVITGYLSLNLKVPIIVVVEDEENVVRIANDINALFDIDTTYLIYDPTDRENRWRNASLAGGFVRGEFSVLVATGSGIKDFPAVGLSLTITKESKWDFIIDRLTSLGYRRVFMVERRGEFSIRGGIVDIYPVNLTHPVRLDFFGDEIASIRKFHTLTQKSVGEMDTPVNVLPVNPAEVSSNV
ncbi:MAG TPA: hypothetical protein P5310_07995, partial [bacterium]|nr:hypothetical protein [bacterium]